MHNGWIGIRSYRTSWIPLITFWHHYPVTVQPAMKFISCILLFIAGLISCSAYALSIEKATGSISMFFPKGSSILSDADKVHLARRLPHIKSIEINIIVVVIWSVQPDSETGSLRKSKQDMARLDSVRQFFLDAGMPKDKVYLEVRAIRSSNMTPRLANRFKDGLVEIEYGGYCKLGFESICFER
jgi:hypothetical protein